MSGIGKSGHCPCQTGTAIVSRLTAVHLLFWNGLFSVRWIDKAGVVRVHSGRLDIVHRLGVLIIGVSSSLINIVAGDVCISRFDLDGYNVDETGTGTDWISGRW